MQTLEPVVASLPLFSGMKEEHIVLVAGCARNVRFEPGEYVGRLGETADRFWVVREGRVALQVHAPDRGPLTVQTVGENEVLGWSWLVPPHQWHFDARALTPVRAIVFDGRCLRDHFRDDYELGYELVRRFSRVIVDRVQSLAQQVVGPASERR